MMFKEFGADFMSGFDLVFDTSQYSNQGLFNEKFAHTQDTYMMELFLKNVEMESFSKKPTKMLFEHRDLRCSCASFQRQS
jgi:hypothetical protein